LFVVVGVVLLGIHRLFPWVFAGTLFGVIEVAGIVAWLVARMFAGPDPKRHA